MLVIDVNTYREPKNDKMPKLVPERVRQCRTKAVQHTSIIVTCVVLHEYM